MNQTVAPGLAVVIVVTKKDNSLTFFSSTTVGHNQDGSECKSFGTRSTNGFLCGLPWVHAEI